MRPIPECDLVPERLQGRPWWGAPVFLSPLVRWKRNDGQVAMHRDESGPVRTPEQMEVEKARIDAEHPIPAPPLRAGQVWLLEARNAFTTYLVGGGTRSAAWFPPYAGTQAGWPEVLCKGSATWESSAFGDGGMITVRYYLLFDPVDPGCAPWSAP